jgi:hypothetical protein
LDNRLIHPSENAYAAVVAARMKGNKSLTLREATEMSDEEISKIIKTAFGRVLSDYGAP